MSSLESDGMPPISRAWLLPSLLVTCLLAVPVAAQDDVFMRARAMATSGQRAEAIALLREHLQTRATDVDARVLLGTVLSREGQYDEARSELRSALQQNPGYADALAALINVELSSQRPRVAKDLAEQALAAEPNDGRFIEARRRAVDAIDALRPWGVSAGYSAEWLKDDPAAWREFSASIRRATRIGALILRGARAERFGVQDDHFEFEMSPRLRSGTYLYASFGISPDHVLFPEYRVAADVYQALGSGFEVAAGLRRVKFDAPTDIYVGTLNKHVGKWLLSGRMFYAPDQPGESARSYHGSVRRYFGGVGASFVGLRYSRGFAREEIRTVNDFEVLSSDTVSGELNTNVGSRLTFGMTASSSRQERAGRGELRQHAASTTIGVRF